LPLDWDAETYTRVGTGIMALGHEVLERTELRGDEVVLDAGCGPGELTAELAARVPRGRVYAVDGSPRMAQLARERLSDRATVWVSDLLELEVPEPVDVVFSAATFHWIADHDTLFRRLRAALRPGGRLVAQCGGAGNIAAIREAIVEVSGDPWMPWNFAAPEETEERLRAAGFAQARAWLYDRPVKPDEPLAFLKTVILGEHLPRLPEGERDAFAQAVLDRLERPFVAGYVRLNMEANAGGTPDRGPASGRHVAPSGTP
jgi:trans-aconitate 2-methyltransferase